MIYHNENIGWFKHLFPDVYEAMSLQDFLREKDSIPAQSPWKKLALIGYFSTGNNVVIQFSNIDLKFAEKGYLLSDLTNSFLVHPPLRPTLCLHSALHRNLSEGRHYEISIQYTPLESPTGIPGNCYLHGARKIGPLTPDRQQESTLEKMLAFSR